MKSRLEEERRSGVSVQSPQVGALATELAKRDSSARPRVFSKQPNHEPTGSASRYHRQESRQEAEERSVSPRSISPIYHPRNRVNSNDQRRLESVECTPGEIKVESRAGQHAAASTRATAQLALVGCWCWLAFQGIFPRWTSSGSGVPRRSPLANGNRSGDEDRGKDPRTPTRYRMFYEVWDHLRLGIKNVKLAKEFCAAQLDYCNISTVPYVLAFKEKLLHYISDEVAGGSYKYYSLTYDGFIRIILTSEIGDADIYASQITAKPTYEPDQYCLKSATCGEDIILIPDRGLGIETVFANILKAYIDPGNLVIVLGTTNHDEQYFIDTLKKSGVKQLPRVITSECSSDERAIMYLEGGAMFMSGPILVVDLLKNRVPLNLVTGILVYRAHNILNSYQEAFALRLYRQNNKVCFIKAFSNSALAFTVGFMQVERVMKTLFVKQLYLWPRFHSLVNSSLGEHEPEVIEFHVKITPKMLNIQSSLLDVMNYVVKEIKKLNKYVDLDELTVENAIARKFHKQLQSQLDPMWHQLSSTSKQLLSDLKTLRALLACLTHEDCVSFYSMLNRLRTMEYAVKNSGWLMLDSVDILFKNAKDRVYNEKTGELKPEANPKWTALTEVLLEIQHQNKKKGNSGDVEKILVLVHDRNICYQLRNYLTMGSDKYLLYEAMKKLPHKEILKSRYIINLYKIKFAKKINPTDVIIISEQNVEGESTSGETNNDDTDESEQDTYVLTLSQQINEEDRSNSSEDKDKNQTLFQDCSQMAELDLTSVTTDAPIILIQSLKRNGDPMSLQRALAEHMPRNIIMYVADISAVRQIEVYQNNNPTIDTKVYFLIYEGSVEEQEYLTSLRREKEAFHKLINAKTTMIIPADQDGKTEDSLSLSMQTDTDAEDNTRKGGLQIPSDVTNTVIVDMREFRSELPAILYTRGFKIEPVTLQVGDYILSPEICVERKSISDLIGSLNSGRLYNQAISMTRHYTKPMLLIEFDPNKPFCFQGYYYASKDVQNMFITSKLQLLTMHFPRLKLVWSPGPHATAQLFEELKQGRSQPNAITAAQIGVEENKQMGTEKFNSRIQDFIARLPGATTKNVHAILNNGQSLDHLNKLTKEELTEMIGNKNEAQMLYSAFHEKISPAEEKSKTNGKKATYSRGRGKRLFSKIKQ
ncbi:DNA repair endonuclease XPF [Dufourea novaeangliae]|uniref:DNA repair endonuclease XPF n=1 Tax=Dufourea novaeangliae TaxID=178035 RepID=A0A154PG49_DUFNO|nr:DNA repair endonuclease XPF [Dufourea novaeangliae]